MRADELVEGSSVVREEWILGGTAVCILSMLRRPSSPQDMVKCVSLVSKARSRLCDGVSQRLSRGSMPPVVQRAALSRVMGKENPGATLQLLRTGMAAQAFSLSCIKELPLYWQAAMLLCIKTHFQDKHHFWSFYKG